jgi:hypothetical protein
MTNQNPHPRHPGQPTRRNPSPRGKTNPDRPTAPASARWPGDARR